MAAEYERRFTLTALPAHAPMAVTFVRQVYWDLGDGWSMRLRRVGPDESNTRNLIAVKGPRQGIYRPEYEWDIGGQGDETHVQNDAARTARALFRAGAAHTIVKTRKSYLIDGHLWDVDVFEWDNEGLMIAEIELRNPHLLAHMPVPNWIDHEVTDDPRYNNERLAYSPWRTWPENSTN